LQRGAKAETSRNQQKWEPVLCPISRKNESGEAEIAIERLGHQGDGVAVIAGRAVHVPLTAPGDRVHIAYGGGRAHVLARVSDGPDRVAAPCPYFGVCGGCALQHVSEAAYRRFKHEALKETLAQRGFADPPLADLTVVPAATRRRATFAFRIVSGAAMLGFYRANTRAVLDIEACLLLRPEIAAALPGLRRLLSQYLPEGSSGRLHVTASESGLDVDLTASPLPPSLASLAGAAAALDLARLTLDGAALALRRKPVIHLGGVAVSLPPRAFLQPSAEGEAALVCAVKEGVGPAKRVLDLFCGLGTFALPLAKAAAVHAVDSDEALLAALGEAARHAPGLKPVTLEARDLMRSPIQAVQLGRYDAVVFDPPRAGAKLQAEALAQAQVPRIVAVSCNDATFARDARRLCEAGYRLNWIRPLDQFLWSAHIELVALFTRGKRR
jgi:23S rRNA (uracil1939-C5)-methyltransferase